MLKEIFQKLVTGREIYLQSISLIHFFAFTILQRLCMPCEWLQKVTDAGLFLGCGTG